MPARPVSPAGPNRAVSAQEMAPAILGVRGGIAGADAVSKCAVRATASTITRPRAIRSCAYSRLIGGEVLCGRDGLCGGAGRGAVQDRVRGLVGPALLDDPIDPRLDHLFLGVSQNLCVFLRPVLMPDQQRKRCDDTQGCLRVLSDCAQNVADVVFDGSLGFVLHRLVFPSCCYATDVTLDHTPVITSWQ